MPPRIAGARAPDLGQVAAEAILGTPGEPGKSRGLHPVRIEAFRGRRVRRDIREQARETLHEQAVVCAASACQHEKAQEKDQ